jgi:hypothetical protein
LLSWLSEIDADELPPDPPELPEAVLLELLLLLHPAMSSAAVPAAAAASPALADIEYTDVPRLAFSADMLGHARDRNYVRHGQHRPSLGGDRRTASRNMAVNVVVIT